MPAPEITLRTALTAAITAQRDLAEYSNNTFAVEETYWPRATLEGLATPKVRLVPVGPTTEERRTRGNADGTGRLHETELHCQIDLVQKVDPNDVAAIDALVDLFAELRQTARSLAGYDWRRITIATDPNGVHYDYVRLRTEHVFQAMFQTTYHFAQKD